MVFSRKVFFILWSLSFIPGLSAQNTINLRGKVLADNFSPLVSAGVYVSPSGQGVYTDSSGEFNLRLPPGACQVTVSFLGYRTLSMTLNLTHDTLIEVPLKADMQLKQVMVIDKQQLKAADHNPDGVISLRTENFQSLPAMLGEHDPIKAVMMQPGVQSGNEGGSGILIQGGSPDQTLILLDGATVFNPSHLYGIISVFNSDAVSKIDIYKDAYPAQFGGRLGSVLDITGSDGNSQKLTGTFSVGIVTSKFHLDGPVDKSHNTIVSVSVRGSFIGLFTEPISAYTFKSDGVTGGIGYYFEDINAHITHHFSDKDQLTFSFFQNKDFYKYQDSHKDNDPTYTYHDVFTQLIQWANYVSSLKWTHQFNDKWKWNNTAAFTDYIFTPNQSTNIDHDYFSPTVYDSKSYSGYNEISYVEQFSLKSEASFTPNAIQTIKFGASFNQQQFEVGGGNSSTTRGNGPYTTILTPLDKEITNPVEEVAFFQDEIKPVENLLINAGVHAQNYTVNGKDYFGILPRLTVAYTPVKNLTFRASVSGLMQDLHLLTPSNSGVLNDNWVPATATAPPETGWNYSFGVVQKLPFNFEWSIDGFYRSMKNLVDYQDGADYSFEKSNWEQQVATGGIGRAYGLEAYIARSFGRITGSIAYTLAWSDRKFTDLNSGNWFPYTYDRRHDVATQINYLLNKHIEFGAAWVYGSGNMTTLPIQNYNTYAGVSGYQQNVANGYTQNTYAQEITAYTPRNGYRLPSYQHLDISFTYKKKVKNLEHQYNISIYNVYNHFNVFELISIQSSGANGAAVMTYKELSLFPILPAFTYTLKFGIK